MLSMEASDGTGSARGSARTGSSGRTRAAKPRPCDRCPCLTHDFEKVGEPPLENARTYLPSTRADLWELGAPTDGCSLGKRAAPSWASQRGTQGRAAGWMRGLRVPPHLRGGGVARQEARRRRKCDTAERRTPTHRRAWAPKLVPNEPPESQRRPRRTARARYAVQLQFRFGGFLITTRCTRS